MCDNAGTYGKVEKSGGDTAVIEMHGGDATSAGFALPELLELILAFLPIETLLWSKRVSSAFRDSINRSPKLRRKLFLIKRPTDDGYDTVRRYNSFLARTEYTERTPEYAEDTPVDTLVFQSGGLYWRWRKPDPENDLPTNPVVFWRWEEVVEDEDEVVVHNKPSRLHMRIDVEMYPEGTHPERYGYSHGTQKIVDCGSFENMYFSDPPMGMNVLIRRLAYKSANKSKFVGEIICEEGGTVRQLLDVLSLWKSGAQAPDGFGW